MGGAPITKAATAAAIVGCGQSTDGTEFTQLVFRLRRCVMALVLDDPGARALPVWRHRFIIGKWVWELPGGYGEDGVTAAIREAEEETGWRPRDARFLFEHKTASGRASPVGDWNVRR